VFSAAGIQYSSAIHPEKNKISPFGEHKVWIKLSSRNFQPALTMGKCICVSAIPTKGNCRAPILNRSENSWP